ncbi:MAG: DinB family protein [Chloroflexota bacterium]|nr:DinB family protein [Chloroflexota bacterium]
MQALSRYRRWQLWAMEKNPVNIEQVVTSISDPGAFARRDGGDGWTISEVLGHLFDVDSAFLARARALAAGNDPPPSSGKSPDEMVIEAGYAEQDALALLEKWKDARASYHAFLSSLPEDDAALWERPGRDADGGGFTLNDQLILTAYHDCDHLHQIVKIIRG